MINRLIKFSLFVLCLLTLPAPRAGYAQSQQDSLAFLKKAQALVDPGQKIDALTSILAHWPHFSQAQYLLGAELYRAGDFSGAIPHFEQVMRDNPALATEIGLSRFLAYAYNETGAARLRQGEPQKALALLQKSISIDSSNAVAFYNLGNAYHSTRQYQPAVSAYLKALSFHLDNPDLVATFWHNLGVSYFAQGDLQPARDAFATALQEKSDFSSARRFFDRVQNLLLLHSMLARADSILQAGDPQAAMAVAQEILANDPQNDAASGLLERAGQALHYQNMRGALAAGELERAASLAQNFPADYRDVDSLRAVIDERLAAKRQRLAIQQLYEQAFSLYKSGELAGARDAFERLLRTPGNYYGVSVFISRIDSLLEAEKRAQEIALIPGGARDEQASPDSSTVSPTQAGDTPFRADLASKETPPPVDEGAASKSGQRAGLALRTNFLPVFLWLLAGICVLAFIGILVQKYRNGRAGEGAGSLAGAAEAAEATGADDEVSTTNLLEIREGLPEEMGRKALEEQSAGATSSPEEAPAEFEGEEPPAAENAADLRRYVNDEDFLALVAESEIASEETGDTAHENDSGSLDANATRTIDMSRMRIRKIGRYVIDKEIGRGAAGRVYKAWDPKLDRTVVIKTVSYNLTASKAEIQRLKTRVHREAKTAAKLNHPNIVVVYDVEDEPTFSYIVMEYIEGMDLRELLDKEKRLAPTHAIEYVEQVCTALHFAHAEGIVHRDIKPSNIVVLDNDKIKVTDFGIAKVTNNLTLTQTGKVVGTPSYMAPEQIEGHEIDHRADIFSLGVVFYELLTGERPFAGESLASLAYKIVHVEPTPASLANVELSEVYDEIINQALAKDPAERFQDADQFLAALQKIKEQVTSS